MRWFIAALIVFALVFGGVASAVTIETVPVGNPGNAPDTRYDATGVGSVDYTYRIGNYEVTNGQYIEFLNAVAAVGDPNNLYNTNMFSGTWGGIGRSGLGIPPNPWVYAAKGYDNNWLLRPVNYVSWYDALRFVNWLENAQPTGDQTDSTTEDGVYDMDGALTRKAGSTFFLPTEDEWYKAAYHKNDGITGNYWDYPTASMWFPTAEAPPGTDMTYGSANYQPGSGGFVDNTYGTTPVGAYTARPSTSPYGTFDQGGNLWEWNETVVNNICPVRGGAFNFDSGQLYADSPWGVAPADEYFWTGFRVASSGAVPEPSTLFLLLLGAAGLSAYARRRRR